MQLFGYSDSPTPTEEIIPAKLAEVTLAASATELRSIAKFLVACADDMERMAGTFDHVHLSDRVKSFRSSPHFVVSRDHSVSAAPRS